MKKVIISVALLIVAAIVFLFLYFGMGIWKPHFDAVRYLQVRQQVDAVNMEIFDAGDDVAKKMPLLAERDSLWGIMVSLRTPSGKTAPSQEVASVPAAGSVPVSSAGSFSDLKTIFWIIGGLVAVILFLGILFLLLRRRQEAITRQMEKIRSEQRFKAPRGGFQEDPTYVTRTRVHRSIIDEAASTAENAQPAIPRDIQFEDEHGLPENRIFPGSAESPSNGRPPLRPTARNRITSAMQSLSDALTLRAPKGVSRENTMKVRAQSRNTMSSSALGKAPAAVNPMEVTRFDKARDDKEKVLQLMRRGYTASEIARRTQLPQDQVDTVIRIKRETGE